MKSQASTSTSCSNITISPLGYYKDLKEVMNLVEIEQNDKSVYLNELFFPSLGTSLEDFNAARAQSSLYGSYPYKILKDQTLIGLLFVVNPVSSD